MWNRQIIMHVYLPILVGGIIYTLFRVDTLLVFKLYEILHIKPLIDHLRESTLLMEMPTFVIYSLPDGIWVYAFTYYLVSIWKYDRNIGYLKFVVMAIPLVLGVGGELAQIFFKQIGTFDAQDLIISLIAFVAGYITVRERKEHSEGEIVFEH